MLFFFDKHCNKSVWETDSVFGIYLMNIICDDKVLFLNYFNWRWLTTQVQTKWFLIMLWRNLYWGSSPFMVSSISFVLTRNNLALTNSLHGIFSKTTIDEATVGFVIQKLEKRPIFNFPFKFWFRSIWPKVIELPFTISCPWCQRDPSALDVTPVLWRTCEAGQRFSERWWL